MELRQAKSIIFSRNQVLIENYLFGQSLSIKSYKSKYYGVSGTKKVKLFNPDFHNKKKFVFNALISKNWQDFTLKVSGN